jgi:hypothetical protein
MSKKVSETDRYKSSSPDIDELLKKEFSSEPVLFTKRKRSSSRSRNRKSSSATRRKRSSSNSRSSIRRNSSSSVKPIRKKKKRSKNISNDRYTSSSPSLSNLLNPNKFKKKESQVLSYQKVVLEKRKIQEKIENKIKIFKEKYIFTYIINANFCKNSYW